MDIRSELLLPLLDDHDDDIRLAVVEALGDLGDERAAEPLLRCIDNPDDLECVEAATALVQLNDTRGDAALRSFLVDASPVRRVLTLCRLARQCGQIDRMLLARDIDGVDPWLDPADEISRDRMRACAEKLKISEEDVRSRYESLADKFGLKLSWRSYT